MRLISIILSLVTLTAAAEPYDDLLKELRLPKKGVAISQVDVSGLDDVVTSVETTIRLKKPAKFRGNKIEVNSVFVHDSVAGLTTFLGAGKTYSFAGAVCENMVYFAKGKFCSCRIAKPYLAWSDTLLPVRTTVKFQNDSLVLVILPTPTSMPTQALGPDFPKKLRNTDVTPGEAYYLKGNEVALFEGTLDPLCF